MKTLDRTLSLYARLWPIFRALLSDCLQFLYRASFLLFPTIRLLMSRAPASGRAPGSGDQYGSIAREGALITGPRAQEKTEENRSLQLLGQQQSADRKKKDAHSARRIRTLTEQYSEIFIQQLFKTSSTFTVQSYRGSFFIYFSLLFLFLFLCIRLSVCIACLSP